MLDLLEKQFIRESALSMEKFNKLYLSIGINAKLSTEQLLVLADIAMAIDYLLNSNGNGSLNLKTTEIDHRKKDIDYFEEAINFIFNKIQEDFFNDRLYVLFGEKTKNLFEDFKRNFLSTYRAIDKLKKIYQFFGDKDGAVFSNVIKTARIQLEQIEIDFEHNRVILKLLNPEQKKTLSETLTGLAVTSCSAGFQRLASFIKSKLNNHSASSIKATYKPAPQVKLRPSSQPPLALRQRP